MRFPLLPCIEMKFQNDFQLEIAVLPIVRQKQSFSKIFDLSYLCFHLLGQTIILILYQDTSR